MTINEQIWRDLSPFTVGFDNVFNNLDRVRSIPQTNYPPYNIRKGKVEDTFLIELAVAGFSEDSLTITVKENNLTIDGDIGEKDEGFIHQGISQRKFSRNFVLAEDVAVKGSDLANGILTIYAERIVPEEKKSRTVEIGSLKSSEKKVFLSE
jgi:molecular chaperone IbpA|tara:strand:+ start:1219 stop:1674 length:456 start_codon:yes stop_codon:yes gene_type:complete